MAAIPFLLPGQVPVAEWGQRFRRPVLVTLEVASAPKANLLSGTQSALITWRVVTVTRTSGSGRPILLTTRHKIRLPHGADRGSPRSELYQITATQRSKRMSRL